MSTLIPGGEITRFTSKKGRVYVLRYLSVLDVDEITRYINKISLENTYIRFSGEIVTKESEQKYVDQTINEMTLGDKVTVVCWYQDRIVGTADIVRNKENKKRSLHVGIFGISVDADYRGEGVGKVLATTTIEEGIKHIKGLTMIILQVFGINEVAQNLYKSLGFVECGKIPNFIKHKDALTDEVIMYKVV